MAKLYQKFKKTSEKFPSNKIVCWHKNGKWKTKTYSQFIRFVDNFARDLSEMGVGPDDKVAILSQNRPEWLVSDLAVNKIGAVSVPIHFTSNEPLVEFILENSQSGFLILEKKFFEKFSKLFEKISQKIILLDEIEGVAGKNVFVRSDILKNDSKPEKDFGDLSARDDLASIIYTSGTTGKPKGVMLTNDNFISNIESAKKSVPITPKDTFLSFLPLSHVLERMAGSYTPITTGAQIAYCRGIDNLAEDLVQVKPTILVSVPKIFERIYEKIFFSLKDKKSFKTKMFFWAMRQRNCCLRRAIADLLVFRKVRGVFGGKLKFAISGGASLNEGIIKFFQLVNLKIVEGYGLTETSPLVSVNSLDSINPGFVGKAIEGVDVEIGSDKEILVRGPNVMAGYWGRPDFTDEVINERGFFMTGDLGFLDSEGNLKIIGRKKEIIVLSNGKNISPEQVEGVLNLSPYIKQSLVVGHKKKFLSALIVLDKEKITGFHEGFDFSDKKAVKNLIDEELEKRNKNLHHFEAVRDFLIIDREFNIEEGDLTPTLKVRRKIIEAKYQKQIEGLYKK